MTAHEEDKLKDRLVVLRAKFVERCRGELLAAQAFARRNQLAPDERGTLAAIAHRLAGTGGTFGYPDLSAAAAQLEAMLDADMAPAPARLRAALDRLLAELYKVATH